MAQRRIKSSQRYREIVQTLARHGFGFFIRDLGLNELLGFYRRARIGRLDEADMSMLPERIRLTLEGLGPTFIKVGQFLSTRSDVIPEEIILELKKLQESVTPIGINEVRLVLAQSWGKPINEVCSSFEDQPLGAASIGQVHRAVLISGEEVAIKIRRPDIVPRVRADLAILADLAVLAEQRWDWARRMNLGQVVEEFTDAMNEEMNYQQEAANIHRIASQNEKNIRVPKVYDELSSNQVLVMEYVDGIRLDDKEALAAAGVDGNQVAEQLINTVLRQMLEFGYYHADLHPGNIRVIPLSTILFLDFGLLGRLGKETRQSLSSLIICLMMDDDQGIADILIDMGAVDGRVDSRALRRDIERLRQEYYGIPLEEIQIGAALDSLWKVAAQHQVQVPPNMALLARTVMTLEGVIRDLVPQFNILSVAEPYGWQLLAERFHPTHLLREGWSKGHQALRGWSRAPQEIKDLIEDLESGKFRVQLTEEWQSKMEKLEKSQRQIQKSIVFFGLVLILGAFLLVPHPGWDWLPPATLLYEAVFGTVAVLFLWLLREFFFD